MRQCTSPFAKIFNKMCDMTTPYNSFKCHDEARWCICCTICVFFGLICMALFYIQCWKPKNAHLCRLTIFIVKSKMILNFIY